MSAPAIIPFNRPHFGPSAMQYLAEVAGSGKTAGDGPFCRRCEGELAPLVGGGRTFLTPSCTDALEMAAVLLDLGPGDEVIVPSFTFTSSANAFALFGATPVFVDSRADTLNIDETKIEAAVTPRTRAIVVVHYAGVACEMDAILDLAQARRIPVIEDNAHGLFGAYRGRPLGSFGAFATQSFHETKNLGSGEGGALVVNDPSFVEAAEIAREKGTNRSQFFRGQVDKYSWRARGSSYLPSEFTAAILLDQLERAAEIQAHRHALWDAYHAALAPLAAAGRIQVSQPPPECRHPAHMYWVVLPSAGRVEPLLSDMKTAGAHLTTHYVPLHSSDMGRRCGRAPDGCPVASDFAPRLVRLPLHLGMAPADATRIAEAFAAAL